MQAGRAGLQQRAGPAAAASGRASSRGPLCAGQTTARASWNGPGTAESSFRQPTLPGGEGKWGG